MAGWNGLSLGARRAVLGAGAVVLAVLGYVGFDRTIDGAPTAEDKGAGSQPAAAPLASAPATATQPDAQAATAASPETPAATTSDPAPDAQADTAAAPDPAMPATDAIAPRFDVARVAPDGAATVAGAAAPGATVSLLVDGVAVASAVADGQGKFAALFDLPASAAAQVLTLQAVGAGGVTVPGAEKIALAPIAGDATAPDAAEPALKAPAAVLIAPEGVKVLQPGAEEPVEVAENVIVDTISYAPDGAVMLGGRAGDGAALRIYLDGTAIADIAAGPDGAWATTLKDVAAGIYTLRVDQLAEDGTVTSRFETPFKRETLEALAAATAPGATAPGAAAPDAAAPGSTAPEAATPESLASTTPAPATAAGSGETAAAAPATDVSNTDSAQTTAAPTATDPAASADSESAAPSADAATKTTAADPTTSAPAPLPVTVTVQPGYTLWGIAQQNFGEGVMYVQVFQANKAKIKDPNLIYPGQVFTIPAAP